MTRGLALAVLLAACGGVRPQINGPVILDRGEDCGSMRHFLAADRRGFYVVALLEGTDEQALSAIDDMEPLDEAEAFARFEALREPTP